MMAMDYWDFGRTARSNDPARATRARAPANAALFTMTTSPPNWMASTGNTTATAVDSRIEVQSSSPPGEYQWQTVAVSVRANSDYRLSYQIDVRRGDVTIGIEDAIASQWILTQRIDKSNDAIAFKSPGAAVKIVIFGTAPQPSAFTIARLTISGR